MQRDEDKVEADIVVNGHVSFASRLWLCISVVHNGTLHVFFMERDFSNTITALSNLQLQDIYMCVNVVAVHYSVDNNLNQNRHS